MAEPISHPKRVFVFGEAMIELSGLTSDKACVGVAGDTFNTAVYLSRAGIKTSYVSALSDDPFSQRIIRAMHDEQIDTGSVLSVRGAAPGLYAITLDAQGERSFTYWRSASAAKQFFEAPGVEQVIGDMARAGALYLSGISLSIFDEIARRKIVAVAQSIYLTGGVVIFDTNYRAAGWRSKSEAVSAVEAIMPYVSIALPTWEDERDLFGDVDAEACAMRWAERGVGEVVVKAGSRGAFSQSTGWIAPRAAIDPVDTTGAGDSFNGAYIAARLSGGTIGTAISMGHDLAGKVLRTHGAIITDEVERPVCG